MLDSFTAGPCLFWLVPFLSGGGVWEEHNILWRTSKGATVGVVLSTRRALRMNMRMRTYSSYSSRCSIPVERRDFSKPTMGWLQGVILLEDWRSMKGCPNEGCCCSLQPMNRVCSAVKPSMHFDALLQVFALKTQFWASGGKCGVRG